MDKERFEAAARNSATKKGEHKDFRARGLVELGKVASGSATQGLCLEDRKVGSQVIGEDQSRFPGIGTLREVRRGGRRASNRAKNVRC